MEPGWFVVPVGVYPKLLSFVDPPVLCRSVKVQQGKRHHQGGLSLEVFMENLEVCETVSEEAHDILMLSFEDFWGL